MTSHRVKNSLSAFILLFRLVSGPELFYLNHNPVMQATPEEVLYTDDVLLQSNILLSFRGDCSSFC